MADARLIVTGVAPPAAVDDLSRRVTRISASTQQYSMSSESRQWSMIRTVVLELFYIHSTLHMIMPK
jgi:hypothetical protein